MEKNQYEQARRARLEEDPIPQKAYADVTIVFDRSASMMPMRDAVIEGFNDYVKKMQETPGDTRWTLVQFDDPDSAKGAHEPFPTTVFEHKAEMDVPFLTKVDFRPRGVTALVDAVCKVIERTELRCSGREDQVKPVIAIFTDGQENSSVDFTSAQMREKIACFSKKGCEFLYFGANQDAFAEAGKHGIPISAGSGTAGSWMEGMIGGALVAPDGRVAYNASPEMGGLAAGSSPINSFIPTAEGMRMAIGSGMVGLAATVSGGINLGMRIF